MSTARLALAAARPYVSAATNTGGGRHAMSVLKLIDQALAEIAPITTPAEPAEEQPWEPPGGWPDEE